MSTTGSEFVRGLPQEHTAAREAAILQAVEAGDYVLSWTPVTITGADTRLVVFVSTDALRIGTPDDSVRVSTTHETAQRIADAVGAVLPTSKLSDLSWQAASIKLTPHTQDPDRNMADTDRFVEHHEAIERERDGRCGLMRPVGKDWCNTRKLHGRPTRGANYGWHNPRAPYRAATPAGGMLWQPGPGTTHDLDEFTDYSQMPTFVRRECMLTLGGSHGAERDLVDVANDPILSGLVSCEGPLMLRHPAVGIWRPGEVHDTYPSIPAVVPAPIFTRTLRYTKPNMCGDDVAFVQAVVGVATDGYFGPQTKSAVQRWQGKHGLDDDGVVGPKTRAAIMSDVAGKPAAEAPTVPDGMHVGEFDLDNMAFVECRNYTRAKRDNVALLVLHSMEAAEKPSTAEAVASWGASASTPRASWHYAIDNDSIVACVPEDRIAWHAPGANATGVGYELAGYARQSREQWLDDYSVEVIWNAAKLAARRTLPRWNIPLRFIDRDGIREGYDLYKAGKPIPERLRGYTTHNEVSLGVRKSTHTDPGPHFPRDVFERFVREAE